MGPIGEEAAPEVVAFFDQRTSSVQYLVICPKTQHCAIIDPVLDFDEKCGSISTHSADRILALINDRRLTVDWILDTHPHADHFTAAAYLKDKTGAPIAIGAKITAVQALWKHIYNWTVFPADGSQWDHLFTEGESFTVGEIGSRVIFSPGHTLASVTYLIGNAAFIHDTLFMPDGGTARADFPGGDPGTLWDSIQRLLQLPPETRLFTGHDYQPGGREPRWESTVAQQKIENIHLKKAGSRDLFIDLRRARDRTLSMPRLILFALQVNMNAGRLPPPEADGQRYLKYPLNRFGNAAWD